MKINPYKPSSTRFDDDLSAGRINNMPFKAPTSNLTRSRWLICSWYLNICLLALISSSVWAAATTPLGELGNTQLQQDTGDAVQNTCAGFVSRNTPLGTEPLFETCRALVQTNNEIRNEGTTTDSLGLSQDELAASLQQVATEEFAATESLANELSSNRVNTVITRLIEVRRGARGFGVAGFNPELAPALADSSQWVQPGNGERGGSAGEDDVWGRWGVFLNGTYGTGDRDETVRTNEFDFDSYSITTGADYRFTDQFILGAGVTYYDVDTDFDEKPTVNGGDVDADGWGGFVYGTYYADRFYIDGLAGYAKSDYDVRRNILIPSNNPNIATIDETAKASPDSDDLTLSAGAGYDFVYGSLTYGPYARLTYLKVDLDDYTETGAEASGLNLKVEGEDWTSFTSVLGGQFYYALSQPFGVIVPQGRVGWIHEFENDSEDIKAVYVDDPDQNVLRARTDNPDRDYFELGVGVSAVFRGRLQAFFNYDTLLGLSEITDHLFTLGGRWEF